jgi:signal transduction histidine kinase
LAVIGGSAGAPALAERLTAADLAELMGAFNEVTAKLQVSHEQLTAEVARLRGQLREADEQLQRSRRLAGLGEMAAGIAHEIRNPLGSIGLYARMLAEDLADRPQECGVAKKIGRAVRGLDAIVTDVLTFAGEAPGRFSAASAADVAESALEHAGVPACSADIEVVLDAPAAGLELECDEGKLRQALVNVIRNGVEAIEEARRRGAAGRPRIAVRVSPAELGGRGAVAFGVRDTGTGVHGEVTERMFNPFFTTREAGTGLGLAIVHRIVDAHGGRVSVSNNGPRVGDGATVEIVIPRRRTDGARSGREQGESHG